TAGPGWSWVFWVNVPIGLVITAVLMALLPATPPLANRPRLDVLGAILVTASTASLIYALIAAGENGWLTTLTAWLALGAAVGYTLFVIWQRKTASPLMDVRLLVRRPVATGAFLILMATALMIAVFFLGTFYFQHARGYNALHTGLLFLPVALATMAGANLTGRVIGRLGG
ncbi:MFS transporter, partial [Actinomadura adrarensis]